MIDQQAPQPAINPWPVRHLYYSVAGLRLFNGVSATADTSPVDRQSASGASDLEMVARCGGRHLPRNPEKRVEGGPALGGESRTAGTQRRNATPRTVSS